MHHCQIRKIFHSTSMWSSTRGSQSLRPFKLLELPGFDALVKPAIVQIPVDQTHAMSCPKTWLLLDLTSWCDIISHYTHSSGATGLGITAPALVWFQLRIAAENNWQCPPHSAGSQVSVVMVSKDWLALLYHRFGSSPFPSAAANVAHFELAVTPCVLNACSQIFRKNGSMGQLGW